MQITYLKNFVILFVLRHSQQRASIIFHIENDAYVSNFIMTSQEETLSNHITRLSRILLFH
jgi:hypothetical protein